HVPLDDRPGSRAVGCFGREDAVHLNAGCPPGFDRHVRGPHCDGRRSLVYRLAGSTAAVMPKYFLRMSTVCSQSSRVVQPNPCPLLRSVCRKGPISLSCLSHNSLLPLGRAWIMAATAASGSFSPS